jgi:hypothetical protein
MAQKCQDSNPQKKRHHINCYNVWSTNTKCLDCSVCNVLAASFNKFNERTCVSTNKPSMCASVTKDQVHVESMDLY